MNRSRIRFSRLGLVLIMSASLLTPSTARAADSINGCIALNPGALSCQFTMGNTGLAVITASLRSTTGSSTCFVITGGGLTSTPPCVSQSLIGAPDGTTFTITVYSTAVGQVTAATDVSSALMVPETSCTVQEWANGPVSCAAEVYNPFASNGSPVDVQALSLGDIGATLKDSNGNINPQVYSPGNAILAPATSGNPYGCFGQTDQPHESSGDASVHARTQCSVRLPYMYVAVDLYRDRWYGEQYLTSGSSSSPYSPSISQWRVEGVARWHCAGVGTYTYRAYSYHEVRDSYGHGYYASTYNLARFTC